MIGITSYGTGCACAVFCSKLYIHWKKVLWVFYCFNTCKNHAVIIFWQNIFFFESKKAIQPRAIVHWQWLVCEIWFLPVQTYVLGKKKSNMQSNAPAIPNKRQREVAKKKRAKVIKETVLVQESKLRREGGIKTTQGQDLAWSLYWMQRCQDKREENRMVSSFRLRS